MDFIQQLHTAHHLLYYDHMNGKFYYSKPHHHDNVNDLNVRFNLNKTNKINETVDLIITRDEEEMLYANNYGDYITKYQDLSYEKYENNTNIKPYFYTNNKNQYLDNIMYLFTNSYRFPEYLMTYKKYITNDEQNILFIPKSTLDNLQLTIETIENHLFFVNKPEVMLEQYQFGSRYVKKNNIYIKNKYMGVCFIGYF